MVGKFVWEKQEIVHLSVCQPHMSTWSTLSSINVVVVVAPPLLLSLFCGIH